MILSGRFGFILLRESVYHGLLLGNNKLNPVRISLPLVSIDVPEVPVKGPDRITSWKDDPIRASHMYFWNYNANEW